MVEKPKTGTAPVQSLHQRPLHPAARDLQDPRSQEKGAGNEIQLTDAMLKLEKQQPFYGYHYQGRTFDCGSPEGFVEPMSLSRCGAAT